MGLRGVGAARRKAIAAKADPDARFPWQKKKLTRAQRVIKFLEFLPITKGRLLGTKMQLLPSQAAFIRDIYGRPDNDPVRLGIYSEPRGNGKTGLIAGLSLCHLIGPECEMRGEVYSAAIDRSQAGIIADEMEAMIEAVPEFAAVTNVRKWPHRIIMVTGGDGVGSKFEALSSDARRDHGLSPTFWAYDEFAQAKERTLFDNLKTAMGKRLRSLGVVLSTQAADDLHPLSELIDDCKANPDRSVVLHIRSAPIDADPFDHAVIKAANPALGIFLDEQSIFSEAEAARRLPSGESAFRNLRLNQRVSPFARDQLMTPETWDKGAAPVNRALFEDGARPVYGGIDLSANTDLSALVWAVEDDDGIVHLLPRVWTPGDTLAERALKDRAPYDAWVRAGDLIAVPGAAIDYDWIAQTLGDESASMNLVRLNYDRWRIEILRQSLARIGVGIPLTECGQGYKDMSPCVEAFLTLAVDGKIRHGNHPLLKWCFANAVVTRDPANNLKLDKSKSYGRIDVAVAAVMAVGAMKANAQPTVDMAALVA